MIDGVTRHLTLPDQRRLAFLDFGSGEQGTWIHCHGIPGSRMELRHLEEDLTRAGLRIIVPDRPGYGESSSAEDYDFTAHSHDIAALADHLGIERFSLSGFSGGGVFALAVAKELGHRIDQLGLAATPAAPLLENPFDHVSELTANAWQAANNGPGHLASMLEALTDSHQQLTDAMINATNETERHYLTSSHVFPGIQSNMQAAVAQGPAIPAHAMARDTLLIIHPWSFELRSLSVSARLVHGEVDAIIHANHLTALTSSIPGSQAEFIAKKGHYSVLPSIWGLQLKDLPPQR